MKIAVFVGQIHLDTQRKVVEGIYNACNSNDVLKDIVGKDLSNMIFDLHLYSIYSSVDNLYNEGEFEYLNRIDFSQYDGFIMYSETVYNVKIRKQLLDRIKEFHKQCVSIDYSIEGCINVRSANERAMGEIVEHMIKEHGVRVINYISGPLESEDAIKRQQSFRKKMKEYGIEIDERRIYHGDFHAESGKDAVRYFKNHGLLEADAYICANDQMALGAYQKLDSLGIKVPEDTLLSGFDNISLSEYHIPSITSVERYEKRMGELAVANLVDAILNNHIIEDTVIESEPVFRESCCKKANGISIDDVNNMMRFFSKNHINNLTFSTLISESSSEFVRTKSMDELSDVALKYLDKIDVEEFCLCLDDDIENDFIKVALHYEKDTHEKYSEIISRKDIIPKLHCERRGNICIITPVHYANNYYGYIVSINTKLPLENELYHMFLIAIGNAIESVSNYKKMKEMMDQIQAVSILDPLTHIYNRTGFFNDAEPLFERAKLTGTPIFILFADMDGLKKVNDTLGHKAGDQFICDFADVMRDACGEQDVYMRFGGDEFVVFGVNKSEDYVKNLIERMKDKNEKSKDAYGECRLDASIGYKLLSVGKQESLLYLIDEADKEMYAEKLRKKRR